MTRTRKILLSLGVAGLLLGGAVLVLPPLLFSDGVDYSKTVSIKTAPEFQDGALLDKAWALPVAQLYKPGIEYQRNGSFCGPTSVVNVLRSLGTKADQDSVLEGTDTATSMGMVVGGLTLDQLAEIARKKLRAKVTVFHDLDLAGFRAQLPRANDPSVRMILNFHRGPIFGQGGGHHSPIAGYLAAEDLVLVLDVNEKYKPWLVRSERLFEATNTVGRTRSLTIQIPNQPPAIPDRCQTIEVLVALRFQAESNGKSAHTPLDPGGDVVTWFYNPSSDFGRCPTLDAGIDASNDADAADGAAQ